jgi:hypothetical protein
MILFCLIAVIGVITWLLSQEGIWGAASVLVIVVLSGLVAMNFFEPAAILLTRFVPAVGNYADFICLVGLFAGSVFGLRYLSEYLVPVDIRVPDMLDMIGKWGFAAATGYVTMAILLTSLHTAPLPREFFDFKPETPIFLGVAPDRQWLGFTQYVSERSLANYTGFDQATQKALPNIFDGQIRKVGDSPNAIWSSFPIRYATRRSMIARGENAGGLAAPPKASSTPTGAPQGGSVPTGGF